MIRYDFYYRILSVINKQSIFRKNYCNSTRRCHRDNPCYRRKPIRELRNVRQHTGTCHCNLTVTTKTKLGILLKKNNANKKRNGNNY